MTLFVPLALSSGQERPIAPSQDLTKAAAKVREVIGHMGSCADRPPNTIVGLRRAVEAEADVSELDARTSKDGVLVCMHDETVEKTTNGNGKIGDLTLLQLQELDAGSKFSKTYGNERIPTLAQMLAEGKGKIAVMIDLKETGDDYMKKVAATVREHGDPKRTVIGVRSVEQAKWFKKNLPEARQIGLIPTKDDLNPFAESGVKMIRLWPKWLDDKSLVSTVRKLGLELHIGAGPGTRDEVLPLLMHEPESLSADDPAQLRKTLDEIRRSSKK